jgi:transcriptional regulator with XRE-family HTH domain
MADKPNEGTERGVRLPRLRAWRKRRGVTQNELAAKAGVAQATITRAERGQAVNIPNARKIAQALGVEYSELLSDDLDTKAEPAA